jgi:argonaute-like protein implicated in RNA metabolism and viral defense
MKYIGLLSLLFFFIIQSPQANASLNLTVKIGHLVGTQLVEVNKTIAADYNKEIVISAEGLKNKIILNLKKFSNVLVNGNKISPVQIDMKLVNEMEKIIGKTQTVTSFYNRSAQFAVRSTGIITDIADMNVTLNFEETN